MKRRGTRLYFDLDLWEWLKKEAVRRHSSASQVVRDMIVAEMEKQKTAKEPHEDQPGL